MASLLSVLTGLAFTGSASAVKRSTVIGAGAGAVVGGAVAGPVGAVAGGVTGGYIGSRQKSHRVAVHGTRHHH